MTPAELTGELLRLSRLLDDANRAVRDRGRAQAEHERDYRKARALAWLDAAGTAQERKDAVDAATADERYARDLAESDHRAAWEAVRNLRVQMSALQTIAGVERETAAIGRTGPEATP